MGWKRTPGGDAFDDEYGWHDDLAPDDEQDTSLAEWDDDQPGMALAESPYATIRLPAIELEPKPPVIVPGSGIARDHPFIKRRERPLTLRLAILMLMGSILVTGIFAVSPLGSSAMSAGGNGFQALAGSVISQQETSYFWYTAQPGDSPEDLARKFNVQLGGIYKLNGLYAGEEISANVAYKIPTDPNYGKGYRPPVTGAAEPANFGNKRFGPNWWNSMAGNPPKESPCATQKVEQDPAAYRLTSPNWGSHWVRGYIVYGTWVYHTGVDIAAPYGNPIHAAQQGQVIWAGYDATNGLGWSVKIDHCNRISTVYGHMAKVLVKAGDYVTQGQVIGLEGSSGNSTGPHVHFMVCYDNMWVNPMPYYQNDRNRLLNYVPA